MLRLKPYEACSTSSLYLPPPSLVHHTPAILASSLFPPQDLCTCGLVPGSSHSLPHYHVREASQLPHPKYAAPLTSASPDGLCRPRGATQCTDKGLDFPGSSCSGSLCLCFFICTMGRRTAPCDRPVGGSQDTQRAHGSKGSTLCEGRRLGVPISFIRASICCRFQLTSKGAREKAPADPGLTASLVANAGLAQGTAHSDHLKQEGIHVRGCPAGVSQLSPEAGGHRGVDGKGRIFHKTKHTTTG